jgi:hypothetical protein
VGVTKTSILASLTEKIQIVSFLLMHTSLIYHHVSAEKYADYLHSPSLGQQLHYAQALYLVRTCSFPVRNNLEVSKLVGVKSISQQV